MAARQGQKNAADVRGRGTGQGFSHQDPGAERTEEFRIGKDREGEPKIALCVGIHPSDTDDPGLMTKAVPRAKGLGEGTADASVRVLIVPEESVAPELAGPIEHLGPDLKARIGVYAPVPPGMVPGTKKGAIDTVRMGEEGQPLLCHDVPDHAVRWLTVVHPGGGAHCQAVSVAAGDLFPHDQEQVTVPALPSLCPGPQSIVIRQDDEVEAGGTACIEDVWDPPRAIGIEGVDVNNAAVLEKLHG